MTIQRKFILFFAGFTLLVTLSISAISIGFLKETYDRILNAANASFLPVMASHMFFKATLTFAIVSLIVVAVSIPLGILLSRRLSAPYLRIFKNLGSMAKNRLAIESASAFTTDERKVLEKYISLLVDDLKNLKEYEKVKSWKDGARMLMHELKNPLTPLKLSAQSLTLGDKDPQSIVEDIARILSSVKDIEKILSYFKELVNIEFGPLTMFDLKNHFRECNARLQQNTAFPCTLPEDSRPFTVFSEPTLITMVLTNLVSNGLAENKTEFYVDITEKNDMMTVRCITPHAHIGDPSKIFSLGYSTKGKDRGFGLFLCKKISDYLDLNIQCDQDNDSVVFSFLFKRHGATCDKTAL